MTPHAIVRSILSAACALCALPARALDWSDTALGYRYGSRFAEPYGRNDIAKRIVSLTHANGYRYGGNFLNMDYLLSDNRDTYSAAGGGGAKEWYVVYRHTLDLGRVLDRDFRFGPVRAVGATAGFDWNSKSDAGYNSRKRMLVMGPTLMLDVPGFLNVSLLALWESNAPYNGFSGTATARYRYDTHGMLNLAWGLPFTVAGLPLSFEGYANFIAAKGRDEFGGATAPETNLDMQIMADLGPTLGMARNRFKLGLEYQYWKNKFGNDHTGPAGSGAFAKTPMVRAEAHF